jgi:uncharacterized protein YndB with AHSA1/START domain
MHRIEKTILVAAPRPAVWRALTDPATAWGDPATLTVLTP